MDSAAILAREFLMAERRKKTYPRIALSALGASGQAIREHYDVGNKFFQLWLDETMTYSAAMWKDTPASLADAQKRKRAHLIRLARAAGRERVLDVGCGWGSCLEDLISRFGVGHAVGLTLSSAQVEWIESRKLPRVEVRLESWEDHEATVPYDSIISIGALEHFVRPELTCDERVSVYREFFSKCHSMLRPGGWMAIQTQAYMRGEYCADSPLSAIFPESDMPRLSEIAAGFDFLFELESLTNDPQDYYKTLEAWVARFHENRDQIIAVSSQSLYEKFSRFLEGGLKGYASQVFMLLRFSLRRVDSHFPGRSSGAGIGTV
jgi:cyclopropane-fatty-acyl-phospholipid synthase